MTDPKLRPQEFLFLLSDLSAKLQHVLVGGGAAPRNPFGTGANTSLKAAGFHKVNQLFPIERFKTKTCICTIEENIYLTKIS